MEIVLTVDKDNTIHLTRGDTARFSLGRIVNTVTKTNYTPTAEDTKAMAFGKYVYDIQLTMADGDVYTIVPPATFDLLKEVT